MAGHGSPKGVHQGGRKKGTPNKVNATVIEKLERLNCDPIQGMAIIALNKLPCGVCRGEGRTRYLIPEGRRSECDCLTGDDSDGRALPECVWCSGTGLRDIGIRTCQSCYGTLFEACSPAERGKMFAELAQYRHQKLKAIEVSGPGGQAPSWEVVVKTTIPVTLNRATQQSLEPGKSETA